MWDNGRHGDDGTAGAADSLHSPRPLRALVVSHEASRTGAPVVAGHLIRALRTAGYRTTVVHRWGGPLEEGLTAAADAGRREPLRRVRALLQRKPGTRPLADRCERWAARRVIRSVRPDVVWCNTVVTWRYAEEAVRLGVPAVLYGHEQAEWSGTALTESLRAARPGLLLVGCSASASAMLGNAADADPDAISVLHSPVDVADLTDRARAANPPGVTPEANRQRSRVVVACGTADRRKGFDVFVDAALRSTADGHEVTWRWIGRPPHHRTGLPSNVELVGEVDDSAPYLSAADVVVCPSRADSFPLVVLEAMALGKPVVASHLQGIAEQVGDAAVLVPAGDADTLWNAVRDLLDDAERAGDFGRRAHTRCVELWDVGRFSERVRELTRNARDQAPSRALRVVHVMGRLSPGGGVQVVVRRLAEHVDPGEVELHVVTMRPPWDDLSSVPVELHPLGFGGSKMHPWTRMRIMWGAARAVRRLDADVVQLHSGIAWMGILARLACPRTPFVLEVHDAPGSGRHSQATDRFEGFCVRRLGMTAVCHSTQVEEALRELDRIPSDRIRRFPLGIDTGRFTPITDAERTAVRNELGLAPSDFIAIGIGRPAPSKRFDLTLDSVAAARQGGAEVTLVLVGVGEHPGLADQRDRLGLSEGVALLDGRHGSDLVRIIAASDVLVSASDYEGFGLTLIEGMACGLPVVAAAVGGVVDIVIDGETGFLVEPGSSDAIADRLVTLAGDPVLKEQLGAAGRARAVGSFDATFTAEAFHHVYRELAR